MAFCFGTRDEAKAFWKKCIEHHSFFRCVSIKRLPRPKSKLLTRGSSFRYNGLTQKELIDKARDTTVLAPPRVPSQPPASRAQPYQPSGTQSLNRNLSSSGGLVAASYGSRSCHKIEDSGAMSSHSQLLLTAVNTHMNGVGASSNNYSDRSSSTHHLASAATPPGESGPKGAGGGKSSLLLMQTAKSATQLSAYPAGGSVSSLIQGVDAARGKRLQVSDDDDDDEDEDDEDEDEDDEDEDDDDEDEDDEDEENATRQARGKQVDEDDEDMDEDDEDEDEDDDDEEDDDEDVEDEEEEDEEDDEDEEEEDDTPQVSRAKQQALATAAATTSVALANAKCSCQHYGEVNAASSKLHDEQPLAITTASALSPAANKTNKTALTPATTAARAATTSRVK